VQTAGIGVGQHDVAVIVTRWRTVSNSAEMVGTAYTRDVRLGIDGIVLGIGISPRQHIVNNE
jgi:hypothetical protein